MRIQKSKLRKENMKRGKEQMKRDQEVCYMSDNSTSKKKAA
jgi:hypothetical protein